MSNNDEDNLFDNSKVDKDLSKYQLMKSDVEKHIDDYMSINERNRRKTFWTIICTIIITACFCYLIFGYSVYKLKRENQLYIRDAKENTSSQNVMNTLNSNLKSLNEFISGHYYFADDIDYSKVITSTMQGYVEGLGDEYSEYFSAEEYAKFNEQALGSYYGIGVYLTEKDGHCEVVSTIKNSPAEEAGLKSGDIIVGVNDEDVSKASSEEIVSKIKGEENTPIKLTIMRKNEYLNFDMATRAVQVYHVESKMLDNNIGYIQLLSFSEGCAEELKSEFEKLKDQGAKKYVIDLRYNTGGLVDECTKIASYFLPIGSVVYHTRVASGAQDDVITKTQPIDTDSQIVLLVNEYSASASEILAGALKDLNRARLVGKKTYGKGVIQGLFQMQDGSALKLTIAEYLTPNNISINKVGIEPDQSVELPDTDGDDFVDTQLKSAQEMLK